MDVLLPPCQPLLHVLDVVGAKVFLTTSPWFFQVIPRQFPLQKHHFSKQYCRGTNWFQNVFLGGKIQEENVGKPISYGLT